MPTGKVKWFDEKKGFGFITADTGDDFFFHFSAIQVGQANHSAESGFKKLADDDRVSFETSSNEKGPIAVNIVRLT